MMSNLVRTVEEMLYPFSCELCSSLFQCYGGLNCCGYAASVVTNVLQRKMPEHQVRVGFGYYGSETEGRHHFWTEIDEMIFVDSTFGQFHYAFRDRIIVGGVEELPLLQLTL